MKRILSLLLVLALLVSAASAAYYEPFDHPEVPFSDMAYTGIDVDAAKDFCARFAREPVALYPELLALYDDAYTQNVLAYIRMCQNAGNAAYAEESAASDSDLAAVGDLVYAALAEALQGPSGDELSALMPEGAGEAYATYQPMADEESAACDEEAALIRDYYLLPEDESFADNAARHYLRLVELRREEAKRAGYDSYPEYAYAALFAREYAPEEMTALYRAAKKQLSPLLDRCAAALQAAPPLRNDSVVPDGEEILRGLAAHLDEVSPELEEAMAYLLRNRLYTIGSSEPLLDTGYTSYLAAWRAPYLFNRADSRFYAYLDAVHEFGHYNAAYHDPTPVLFQLDNMDVAELQSQGLEMLFLPCLQELLAGEDEEARATVALSVLYEMLSSVIDGCQYDEFEQEVYTADNLSVESLHELDRRLSEEYGYVYEPGDEPYWVNVSHLFSDPFYMISYAISAIPALDLYLRSLENRSAAVDAYLRISAARTDAWYFDVLYDNDLCDPTDAFALSRLFRGLNRQLTPLTGDSGASQTYVWLIPAAGGALVGLLLLRRKFHGNREAVNHADKQSETSE